MKQLLENWNNFLNEGIDARIQKQLDAILALPDIGVLIYKGSVMGFTTMSFRYVRIVDKDTKKYSILTPQDTFIYKDRKTIKTGIPNGYIEIREPLRADGPCLDGWVVGGSLATTGFGPLLYEVAIEWSSQNGEGLTPDRKSVSTYAARVWANYMSRSDVEKKQLDATKEDPVQRLTRPVADDCSQVKSVKAAGDNWMNSPFAKMYSKSNTEVIDALRAAGRLIEE